jgi:predicted MFS family arabinose efflux permease
MPNDEVGPLDRTVLFALTLGCGLSVSSLYYLQPLLEVIAKDFRVQPSVIGTIAMLIQIGYVGAMLFIAPLGDARDRRVLILKTCAASAACLVLMAIAPNVTFLGVSAFALGFSTATPQLIVPLAASIAEPERRGRVVGTVLGGLMAGILLGRVFSGAFVGMLSWRGVLFAGAILTLLLSLLLAKTLPSTQPSVVDSSYRRLLQSVGEIARDEWRLRYSCWFGAMSFAAFSAFWTTLSFQLKTLGYGPDVAGAFGLIGVVGAFVAPISGRFADRKLEHLGNLASLFVLVLTFGALWFVRHSVVWLVVAVVVLDFAAVFNHVSNQSRNYTLRPNSQSRVNTVYMTCYFLGGALGSFGGSVAWQIDQWRGVCILGGIFSMLGALIAIPYYGMTPENELIQ